MNNQEIYSKENLSILWNNREYAKIRILLDDSPINKKLLKNNSFLREIAEKIIEYGFTDKSDYMYLATYGQSKYFCQELIDEAKANLTNQRLSQITFTPYQYNYLAKLISDSEIKKRKIIEKIKEITGTNKIKSLSYATNKINKQIKEIQKRKETLEKTFYKIDVFKLDKKSPGLAVEKYKTEKTNKIKKITYLSSTLITLLSVSSSLSLTISNAAAPPLAIMIIPVVSVPIISLIKNKKINDINTTHEKQILEKEDAEIYKLFMKKLSGQNTYLNPDDIINRLKQENEKLKHLYEQKQEQEKIIETSRLLGNYIQNKIDFSKEEPETIYDEALEIVELYMFYLSLNQNEKIVLPSNLSLLKKQIKGKNNFYAGYTQPFSKTIRKTIHEKSDVLANEILENYYQNDSTKVKKMSLQ